MNTSKRTHRIIETLHYINVAAAIGIITFTANLISTGVVR